MITIELSGTGAEDVERELLALLQAELGVEARRAGTGPSDAGRKIDPNTLATLAILLAVPGAVDATANLVKRVELVQKVKRLIAWAKGRSEGGVRIRVISKRSTLDLGTADPGDVVEALTEAEESGKTGKPQEKA